MDKDVKDTKKRLKKSTALLTGKLSCSSVFKIDDLLS